MTLPRIAGVFLVMSLLANVTAFAIGTSRGLRPPPAFDFGSAEDLLGLAAESRAHLLPLALSLISPVLAIPAGLGWFHILRPAGWTALFGVTMFFAGMVFVVLLDVIELIAILRVAPAYASATELARPSILALGSSLELARTVLGYVGHFLSFGLAQLALGYAIVKVPGISNWLGGLSFVPAIMLGWMVPVLGFAGQAVGPVVAIGISVFFIWLVGMSVVLLRWEDQEEL